MTLLVPTLRVGMPSWPLSRPEERRDARASGLAPTLERGSQSDTLVTETEQAISLLQERRTALISAAVTGKIDVRGLAQEVAA